MPVLCYGNARISLICCPEITRIRHTFNHYFYNSPNVPQKILLTLPRFMPEWPRSAALYTNIVWWGVEGTLHFVENRIFNPLPTFLSSLSELSLFPDLLKTSECFAKIWSKSMFLKNLALTQQKKIRLL